MIKTIKCLLLAAVCFFAGSMAAYRLTLSREVVRIRVIAASDSDRDQGLKMKVRDAVLSDLEDVPREALEEQLPELQTVAERALEAHGASDPVRVTLGREPYRRTPEDAPDLPSGTYETLCLTIGAGEGHNWWGVLYPKLCYGAQSCLETGTERRLRFFVLEKLDGVKQWVEEIMAPQKAGAVSIADCGVMPGLWPSIAAGELPGQRIDTLFAAEAFRSEKPRPLRLGKCRA